MTLPDRTSYLTSPDLATTSFILHFLVYSDSNLPILHYKAIRSPIPDFEIHYVTILHLTAYNLVEWKQARSQDFASAGAPIFCWSTKFLLGATTLVIVIEHLYSTTQGHSPPL